MYDYDDDNDNNNNNNHPVALQFIKGQGLPTYCKLHYKFSVDRGEKLPGSYISSV